MKTSSKIAIASGALLLLLLLFTDPSALPSAFLMVPFVLVFIALSAAVSRIMIMFGLTISKARRVGYVFSSIPVLLLALQSLGQLTLRDVLVVLVFFVLAYFYVSKLEFRVA